MYSCSNCGTTLKLVAFGFCSNCGAAYEISDLEQSELPTLQSALQTVPPLEELQLAQEELIPHQEIQQKKKFCIKCGVEHTEDGFVCSNCIMRISKEAVTEMTIDEVRKTITKNIGTITKHIHKQRLAMIIISTIGILTVFLPWASIWGISVSGMEVYENTSALFDIPFNMGWISIILLAIPLVINIFVGKKLNRLEGCIGIITMFVGVAQIIYQVYRGIDIGYGLILYTLAGATMGVAATIKSK